MAYAPGEAVEGSAVFDANVSGTDLGESLPRKAPHALSRINLVWLWTHATGRSANFRCNQGR